MRLWGNVYNKTELAGAFGDLGTLIPFVVGYITLNQIDPVGLLVSFGLFKILAGLYFKTPMPVQPMKAIGGMAIARSGAITPGMIWGSGIFTGLFWLLMGMTGAIRWIEKITTKPVLRGIMLGLGLSLLTEGLGRMKTDPLVAIGGVLLTLLLLNNRRLPAMLALLGYGALLTVLQHPSVLQGLSNCRIGFHLPRLTVGTISSQDFLSGVLLLGLPQVPLTLSNAILGMAAENNAHFPERKVTPKVLCVGHGVMNLVSAIIGGVPICHGAGGMAGYLRFGARTGGALVIMGLILLILGLFLSGSAVDLFQIFPRPILGVILFFAGVELTMVIKDIKLKAPNLFVLIVTGGLAMWNIGIAYVAGLMLYHGLQRRWFKV